MTEWQVQAVIIEPDEKTDRGIETFIVATDGGHEWRVQESLRQAFEVFAISPAGPWKWYVWLERATALTDGEFDLSDRLLKVVALEPHFAHREQVRHLEALSLVRVASQTQTGVVLAYNAMRSSISTLQLPRSINIDLALESEGLIRVDFRVDDPGLRNRQLRALVNYLVLRFDPHDQLTRQIVGEPLL